MERNRFTENIDKYLSLFHTCIPVKGAVRSVICDLENHTFDFIPNNLYDLILNDLGKPIREIFEEYGTENQQVLTEYFTFLLHKNYAFFCEKEELSWFPKMELKWEIPSQIENVIIDIDRDSDHPYEKIFKQLDALGCLAVQLRFFDFIGLDKMNDLLTWLEGSTIQTVDIIVKHHDDLSLSQVENLCLDFPRVDFILVHGVPKDKLKETFKNNNFTIHWTEQLIDSAAHCGFVSPRFFSVNIKLFMESQDFNTCLNAKISIDHKGNIKNCPAFTQSFGNVKKDTLYDAIQYPSFTKQWSIKKDQISICKDCEFRYICTDCRAFIENPLDIYSKPERCKYDPYTATWK